MIPTLRTLAIFPKTWLPRLVWLNIIVVVACLTAIFYGTPLRQELENRLADLKTRLAPTAKLAPELLVLSIDETTIAALSPAGAKDLGFAAMAQLVDAALSAGARVVVPLMHTQIFPIDAPERSAFMRAMAAYPEVFVGVFDLERRRYLVDELVPQPERAYLVRLVQWQWEEVIHRVPVMSTNSDAEQLPFLIPAVADYLTPRAAAQRHEEMARSSLPWGPSSSGTRAIKLNYFPWSKLAQHSAAGLLAGTTAERQALVKDKTVILGYGLFRPNQFRIWDATFLNTPWQNPGDQLSSGVPVANIVATALSNLLQRDWLRPAPLWTNVLQTLALTILAWLLWRTSVAGAVVLFGLLLATLFALQLLVRSRFALELPMADSLFFAVLSTCAGGFARLRLEIRARAREEAAASSEEAVLKAQELYLERFAFALSSTNQRLATSLQSLDAALQEQPQLRDFQERALAGSGELEDYLAGIRELVQALSTDGPAAKVQLRDIDAADLLKQIAQRFQLKHQDAVPTLQLDCPGPLRVATDPVLVEQILLNLLANAAKYAPDSPKIALRGRRTAKGIVLEVEDHGPGIAGEYQQRIFEKFYRIPNAQAYQVRGTGVGLFLCRYFAQLIEAQIGLRSTPGVGSCFSLSLPVRRRL